MSFCINLYDCLLTFSFKYFVFERNSHCHKTAHENAVQSLHLVAEWKSHRDQVNIPLTDRLKRLHQNGTLWAAFFNQSQIRMDKHWYANFLVRFPSTFLITYSARFWIYNTCRDITRKKIFPPKFTSLEKLWNKYHSSVKLSCSRFFLAVKRLSMSIERNSRFAFLRSLIDYKLTLLSQPTMRIKAKPIVILSQAFPALAWHRLQVFAWSWRSAYIGVVFPISHDGLNAPASHTSAAWQKSYPCV